MRAHYNKLVQTEIRQLRRFREQAESRSTPENLVKFDDKIKELEKEFEEETPRYLQFVAEQQELARIQQKHQNEKHARSQTEMENQEKLDAFYKKENQLRRDDRMLQHQMRKEWEWLCKQDEKLPDYIRANLQKMPNNKGYIWKNHIWYFGSQPSENNDLVIMFERPSGASVHLIHEIHKKKYHRIYQKNKDGPNILLSERSLR